jgi:hypothetical protein
VVAYERLEKDRKNWRTKRSKLDSTHMEVAISAFTCFVFVYIAREEEGLWNLLIGISLPSPPPDLPNQALQKQLDKTLIAQEILEVVVGWHWFLLVDLALPVAPNLGQGMTGVYHLTHLIQQERYREPH